MEKPTTIFAILFTFYWGLNELAHCIFIMKYWVLSFKMKNIIQRTEIKNLEIKAKIFFYF